jgi:hypothetical protein
MHTLAIEPRSCLKGGDADEFPTCYVEETQCPKDLVTTLEPQATESETQARSGVKGEPAEEFPICYVEKIPWPGDSNLTHHVEKAMSDDEARNNVCVEMNVDEARAAKDEHGSGE